MDKDLLVFNIKKFCIAKGQKPTVACAAAGVGKSFVSHICDGQVPSVAKVADLAAFLGVSTSDLVGDAKPPEEAPELLACWAELNEEGREFLLQTARMAVKSDLYKKFSAPGMGAKEA